MRSVTFALAAMIGLTASNPIGAQVTLLDDNFDSYADQAAFQTAWPIMGTSAFSQLSTLQSFSMPQSVQLQTTAARSARTIPETAATATDSLLFRIRFFDSNGAAASYRQYGELLDGAGTGNSQIIALGLNNNIASSFYMARMTGVDVPGGTGASTFFPLNDPGAPARSTGWHELAALISPTEVQYFVDGILSRTVAIPAIGQGRMYDAVRLGSNLSSTQLAYIDDASVGTVPIPEPTSLMLGGLGLAMVRLTYRRRHHKN